MMQTMRKNMKLVLWILVFAFIATIVFSWGMGGFKGTGPKQGIAAVINGREITLDRLEQLFQQRYQYEQTRQEADLTEDQVKQMRTQIWDELIRDTLIEQEVQRLGIRANDKEIAYLIRTMPPDFIRENEYFQTEGVFDPQKYEEYLRNPAAARDLMMIEDSYRKSLPNQKFVNQLLALATVSDQEAWQSYREENQKATARYVLFPSGDSVVDSTFATPQRLESYYNEHREEYRISAKRRIIYALFLEQPSRQDSANILQHAEELLQRARQGEDFAELARENSDDRSAENGGDLGFFERGRMVPEFDEAAFSTPVGGITGPVQSRFGYHIIKVTEKKTEDGVEKIRASHILLKIQPSSDTREQIRSSAEGFAEELRESSFAQAAAVYGLDIDTTDYFERGDFIPSLGRLPAAVDFIFARPVGSSGPVYMVRDGLVVFQILDEQKERIQSLAEVKDRIVTEILQEARIDRAVEKGKELRSSLSDPSLFVSQAQAAGLTVQETDGEFRSTDYLKDIGRDPAFTGTALQLEVGQVSQPVKAMKGCYLIQLTQKIYADSAAFLKEREEIRNRLLTEKQNELYSQWLEAAKEKAKIEDYRYLYYRDY
ncbi:MAG TPA: peptidylprolyl isomerase [bacterium]|jgi:peptidyl-prolyl cis-trans isomerase D